MSINYCTYEQLYPCSICNKKYCLSILDVHRMSCRIRAQATQEKRNSPNPNRAFAVINPIGIRSRSNEDYRSSNADISNQLKYDIKAKAPKPNKHSRNHFLSRLRLEMSKDEINYKNSKEQIKCYLCLKLFPLLQIKFHCKTCTYQTSNPILNQHLKPALFDSIVTKIEKKIEVNQSELREYHNQMQSIQKEAIMVECQNCAKKMLSFKLNKHSQVCHSNSTEVKRSKGIQSIDSNRLFAELFDREYKSKQAKYSSGNSNPKKRGNTKSNQRQKIQYNNVESLIKEDEKENKSLKREPCPNCNKTILTERLPIHLNQCKKKSQ